MEDRSPPWSESTTQVHLDHRPVSALAKQGCLPLPPQLRPGSQGLRMRHGFANLRAILLLSICSLLWCSPCIAAAISFENMAAGYSEIIFDSSPPPPPHVRLIKRANDGSSSTKTSTSAGVSATASSTASSALPSPFDSSLGNNFTASSCPEFFQTFLSNSTFNECVPLSLLLQTSTSFFAVEQSPVRLAQTLEATCNVDYPACSAVMASLARQIQMTSNCGADLQAENPTVLQAYNGLAAYQTMYHAGCLQDRDTGNYCFSDAVTNSSSPTSSYIYFTALGVSLPSSTKATCNGCLQDTMTVFAGAATNKSQPIAGVYGDAARLIDSQCGSNFVNTTVSSSSSSSTSAASATLGLAGSGFGPLGLITLLAAVFTASC